MSKSSKVSQFAGSLNVSTLVLNTVSITGGSAVYNVPSTAATVLFNSSAASSFPVLPSVAQPGQVVSFVTTVAGNTMVICESNGNTLLGTAASLTVGATAGAGISLIHVSQSLGWAVQSSFGALTIA